MKSLGLELRGDASSDGSVLRFELFENNFVVIATGRHARRKTIVRSKVAFQTQPSSGRKRLQSQWVGPVPTQGVRSAIALPKDGNGHRHPKGIGSSTTDVWPRKRRTNGLRGPDHHRLMPRNELLSRDIEIGRLRGANNRRILRLDRDIIRGRGSSVVGPRRTKWPKRKPLPAQLRSGRRSCGPADNCLRRKNWSRSISPNPCESPPPRPIFDTCAMFNL